MIHVYRVRLKRVDCACPSDQEVRAQYGGILSGGKAHNSRCTISYKKRRAAGIVSQHQVIVNGTPRHVKDLHRALDATPPARDNSDASSESELTFCCGVLVGNK